MSALQKITKQIQEKIDAEEGVPVISKNAKRGCLSRKTQKEVCIVRCKMTRQYQLVIDGLYYYGHSHESELNALYNAAVEL